MCNTFFSNTVYVRGNRNQLRLKHLESGDEITVKADPVFTSERLLVGDFAAAEHALKKAMKGFGQTGIFKTSPRMLIQPLEKIEGGLCQVEERIFREIARGAGASKVIVWVGAELIDSQVKDKLSRM